MSKSNHLVNELLLFDKIKNGDQKSFKLVYDCYWEPLYLHALIMLEDEYLAKDVVQELFIQLWNKKEILVISQSLKAYLYTSTRNLVISKIRHLNRRHKLLDEMESNYSDVDMYTVEQLEQKDLNDIIDSCIEKLPKKMRDVFLLSRKEYLSTKEIAAITGTAEATVKKQLSNSLKALRVSLEKFLLLCFIISYIFFLNQILLSQSDGRLTLKSEHEPEQKR